MLRISKLTDYGTVVLAHLATGEQDVCSATEVAETTGIALPTVSKILKILARAELVTSTRGVNGGYQIARATTAISAAEIIDALDGPVSITECSSADSRCEHEGVCAVGGAWQRVNLAIRRALDEVSLSDLMLSSSPVPLFKFAGLPITVAHSSEEAK